MYATINIFWLLPATLIAIHFFIAWIVLYLLLSDYHDGRNQDFPFLSVAENLTVFLKPNRKTSSLSRFVLSFFWELMIIGAILTALFICIVGITSYFLFSFRTTNMKG